MQSRVVQDGDDENVIFLQQQWKLLADLNTYFSSDHFRALLGAMKLFGKSYEILINVIFQEMPDDLAGMNRNA